jgi:hypothetical protein
MPVVLTDKTNATWAVENPEDGYLHVGWTGQRGTRLEWMLEFLKVREKQFEQFIAKKQETAQRKQREASIYDAHQL